jgi:hypothetical protein
MFSSRTVVVSNDPESQPAVYLYKHRQYLNTMFRVTSFTLLFVCFEMKDTLHTALREG